MKFCRSALCLVFLLVCSLTFASPKARNWDKVLDRYELLCEKCLELKRLSDSGQDIPKHKFSKLIKELNALKNEVRDASGQMSEEQAERFASIRDRFLEAQGARKRETQPIPPAPAVQAPAMAPPQIIVLQKPVTRQLPPPPINPEDYVVELPQNPITGPQLLDWEQCDGLEIPMPEKKPASKSMLLGRKNYLSGIVCISIYPKPSYGLLLALDPLESRLGAYVRASSNFAPRGYGYDCLSDGTTSYGTIWTSGEVSYFTAQASLGPCYRLNNWLRLYGGLGYGTALTLWEDSSGGWARVLDRSPRGLLFEAGTIFNLGRVNFSLSYTCTALRLSELQLGLGYNF
ncbi:MAG: hypothetical protein ACI3Y4_03470 [Candidatus Cryptobacteroides sp.]